MKRARVPGLPMEVEESSETHYRMDVITPTPLTVKRKALASPQLLHDRLRARKRCCYETVACIADMASRLFASPDAFWCWVATLTDTGSYACNRLLTDDCMIADDDDT